MTPETKVKLIRYSVIGGVILLIVGAVVLVIHSLHGKGGGGGGDNPTPPSKTPCGRNQPGFCPDGQVCQPTQGGCITPGGGACTTKADCSNHGTCHTGACVCDPHYLPPKCLSVCDADSTCSNGGKCVKNQTTGSRCVCAQGWSGLTCDDKLPPTPVRIPCPTDPQGRECGQFGPQVCQQLTSETSACVCPPYYDKDPTGACVPASSAGTCDTSGGCSAVKPEGSSSGKSNCGNGYWCYGHHESACETEGECVAAPLPTDTISSSGATSCTQSQGDSGYSMTCGSCQAGSTSTMVAKLNNQWPLTLSGKSDAKSYVAGQGLKWGTKNGTAVC